MKRLLLCFLLLTAVQLVHAQYYKTDTTRKKEFDASRLIVGGSMGLAFGDYTNINISPLVGYRISQLFAAGLAINAQYGSERFRDYYGNTGQRNQYSIFGGGVWGRVYPLDFLFIHIQPEYNHINLKSTYYDTDPKTVVKDSYGVSSLLMGGGYTQPIGGNAAFSIMALYDVLQDSRSPYQNGLILRVGATIGL
ncbi:hypothetical protein [Chitinophaga filiformis]|uniref:Outer membrane protein beta-barrel domain-containing protein n=1 Tax=Chitinophaga filiformis TaxID=104663 RepID=A0ABY4HZJ4_CHIFI|nr:hypothetical protein [Chitinophaga filiformis]UPK69244.1 hypothetical protein MYF79_30255 [Chitinophaga filiformis]